MSRARTVSMERVLELHGQGLSQIAIGKALNIHRTSARYFLKLAGVPLPHSAYMRGQRAEAVRAEAVQREADRQQAIVDYQARTREMVRLYMVELLSSYKIGARFGCSPRTVARILRMQPDVVMRWPRVRRPPCPDLPHLAPILQKASIERMTQLASGRRL